MVRAGFVAAVGAIALVAGAATSLVVDGDAVAGDAQVADTLFKSGKQALAKGDHAGAIAFFTKAEEETPELIEARWWRASAQEKSGDKGAALASYREFLALLAAKSGSGAELGKEEQRLKGLAEKSVDALAAGEKEFRKIEDAYVAALLAFAKENFVRDPGIAGKAVEALLVLRPGHEEALKLREKVGGPAAGADPKVAAGPATVAKGPFAAVTNWRDLLAEKSIRLKPVAYAGDVMTIDERGGAQLKPGQPIDMGTSYAYEAEFSVIAAHDGKYCVGLTIAERKGRFLAAFVQLGKVEFIQANADGSSAVLEKCSKPTLGEKGAHRLGLIVKGAAVEVWLDGEKLITWRNPDGADLQGELGIFQQSCKSEIRVFRAAKLD
jgi:tetratricopeptide (TPR) repeat protein